MIPHQPYLPFAHQTFFFVVLCFLSILLFSCTGGYLVTEDQVAQITIGSSTQEDVRKVLGEPMSVSKPEDSGNGQESWVYPLSKYASDPNTGVPPIGVVGVPISRGRRKTTEVEIRFDENGVVQSIEERRPPK